MEDLIKKTTGNLCMMKIFNFQDLKIQIVTFNVAQKHPETLPLNILADLPENSKDAKCVPDLFVFGFQELKAQAHNIIFDAMYHDPWNNCLRDLLEPFGYVRVKTTRLLAMGLVVYCLRKHVCHIRNIEYSYERTGVGGLWGNKGGLALRLKIYGAEMCFVLSHFHAHEHRLKYRIEEYNTIIESIKFKNQSAATISQHDYVFWFGDLNFRLNESNELTADEVAREIQKGNASSLLASDQLKTVQQSGEAFSGMMEPAINFKPTFKYIVDSSDYNLSRRPAWCDRILYAANNKSPGKKDFSIKVENYKAIEGITISDHRPVTATFIVKVFLNFQEKHVEFLPIDTWSKDTVKTATVVFGPNFSLRKNDWIGIFDENFSCLTDYYAYKNITDLSPAVEKMLESQKLIEQLQLTFSDDDVSKLHSQNYVLLYLTENGEVLGISSPFEYIKHIERRSSYRPLDSPEAR